MSDVVTRAKAALEGAKGWQVVGDWVAVSVGRCTCYGGGAPYGHEPGCGYEPCGKVEEEPILKFAVDARDLLPELVAEVERLSVHLEQRDALGDSDGGRNMSNFGHGIAVALFFAVLIAFAVVCFYAAGVVAEVVGY